MSSNSFPELFGRQLLGDSTGTVYSVPSAPSTQTLQNLQLMLTNVTGSAVTASVYAVPNAGSASNENALCIDLAVPANDYVLIPVERLPAGASIQGVASAAASINIAPIGGKLHTP